MVPIRTCALAVLFYYGAVAGASEFYSGGSGDSIEIVRGSSEDCNSNAVPDEWDILSKSTLVSRFWDGDGEYLDEFGKSVSVWGDWAVVGAPGDDDCGQDSGSTYVFRRDSTGWVQQAKLLPPNGVGGGFGRSVAVWENRIAVGVCNGGTVCIFGHNGSDWNQEASIVVDAGASSWSTWRVALYGDVLVVGAPNSGAGGAVCIYRFDGLQWQSDLTLNADDPDIQSDNFGHCVSIHGDALAISGYANYAGHVDVYHHDGSNWERVNRLVHPSIGLAFGHSTSLWGNTLVVGNPYLGGPAGSPSAHLYGFDGEDWVEDTVLSCPGGEASCDSIGYSVAVWEDFVAVGRQSDSFSDPVLVYRRQAGQWESYAECNADSTTAYPRFGTWLDVWGGTVLVGASEDETDYVAGGAAFLFELGSDDYNSNGVPDECDLLGDLNGDGVVGAGDMEAFTDCLGGPVGGAGPNGVCGLTDIDQDGDVDLNDFGMLQAAVGT